MSTDTKPTSNLMPTLPSIALSGPMYNALGPLQILEVLAAGAGGKAIPLRLPKIGKGPGFAYFTTYSRNLPYYYYRI